MSVQLTRSPTSYPGSNTSNPGLVGFQYYEKDYSSGTTQEAIYLPDHVEPIGVSLVLVSAGVGVVEATCSPQDLVEAGTATWVPTAITAVGSYMNIRSVTAIRANRTSGTIRISVVC